MGKETLSERITTRISGEQRDAISEFMDDRGMTKEGEVLRMALTQFLRSEGYLGSSKIAEDAPKKTGKLEEAGKKMKSISYKFKRKAKDLKEGK